MKTKAYYNNKGFTLIEIIVVMILVGIVGVTTAVFIVGPINSYLDASRRATIVSNAETALEIMVKDLQKSIPFTARVKPSNDNVLEFLKYRQIVRYRTGTNGSSTAANMLDFTAADTDFDILGDFDSLSTARLLIEPTDTNTSDSDSPSAGVNPYGAVSAGPAPPANSHVITPTTVTVTLTNSGSEDHVNLSPAFQFSTTSSAKRMYLLDTPVTFVLVSSTNKLYKVTNYTIQATQPTSVSSAPLSSGTVVLLAENVTDLDMSLNTRSSATEGDYAEIIMTVQDPVSNESMRFVRQVNMQVAKP